MYDWNLFVTAERFFFAPPGIVSSCFGRPRPAFIDEPPADFIAGGVGVVAFFPFVIAILYFIFPLLLIHRNYSYYLLVSRVR
jgi:hypothetical protein